MLARAAAACRGCFVEPCAEPQGGGGGGGGGFRAATAAEEAEDSRRGLFLGVQVGDVRDPLH